MKVRQLFGDNQRWNRLTLLDAANRKLALLGQLGMMMIRSKRLANSAILIAIGIVNANGCKDDPAQPVHPNPKPPQPVEAINRIGNNENARSHSDVVFVHGLDGDFRETWLCDDDPKLCWPEAISEDRSDVVVWSVNYASSSSAWFGGAMPYEDRAKNLLTELSVRNIGERPLVFITHSLGGIVVKQMLKDCMTLGNAEWKRIAENTKGVVFLATPNTGSVTGEYLKLFGKLYRQTIQVEQLERNASALRDLNLWYRQNAPANGIDTLVFFENEKMPVVGLVVDESSADPGINNVIPIRIDATHVTICKPRDKTDLVYRSVSKFIDRRLVPPAEPLRLSFHLFIAHFNQVRDNPTALAIFESDYVGKRAKWEAFVREVRPDISEADWTISPAKDSPDTDEVLALFAAKNFQQSVPISSKVVIAGTVDDQTNALGVILRDCELLEILDQE